MSPSRRCAVIIGGGPAGLMAAEVLAEAGVQVDLYDAMPSVGRKLLLAGKGGLNLSHAEAPELFYARYGARRAELEPLLAAFGPEQLRAWALGLGIATFVGSSNRIFPLDLKAAPLLRAWLQRLRGAGVRFFMRHRWLGWSPQGALRFAHRQGVIEVSAPAVLLALGGASWARLGSDGAWWPLLAQRGVALAPLRPANCGFDTGWSEHFRSRFAGHPVKTVALQLDDGTRQVGEFIVSQTGIEGSLVYALSARLRQRLDETGPALVHLDLLPDLDAARVHAEVARPRAARSWSSHLQSRLGLRGVKAALLRECLPAAAFADPVVVAAGIKRLPLRLLAARPIDEAISSAGGVAFEALDAQLMLRALPGVFCAGEMLDWEAPTGGYLLNGCLASGRAAGLGMLAWLARGQAGDS